MDNNVTFELCTYKDKKYIQYTGGGRTVGSGRVATIIE